MSFFNSQLFKDVQSQHIFSDCKTFADATARFDWQSACIQYEQIAPLDKTQLRDFVDAHFITTPLLTMKGAANTTSVKANLSQALVVLLL